MNNREANDSFFEQCEELQAASGSGEMPVKSATPSGAESPALPDDMSLEAIESGSPEKINTIGPQQGKQTLLRVDSNKLDSLINFVGELVTSSAHILQIARKNGAKEIVDSTEELSNLVSEIRDSALQLRMVPIGQVLGKFQRIVRDICHELSKDVKLEIYGAETELDKSVIESIYDPLMHIIRNSIDHGIESAEKRRQLAKPPHGLIIIDSWHETGEIVIDVTDDGQGINREKVLARAVERGLLQSGDTPDDNEIYKFLFYPGFSTASSASDASGRGVGLNVVQKNIDGLGGKVAVQSRPGQGTTFQIRLPLTLAIIDGFLVRVADSYFVIPLNMMDECIELGKEDEILGSMDVMNIRGEALGIIDTAQFFNIQDDDSSERRNIVIIRYGEQRTGLLVDELQGEVQSVIKPMGKIYGRLNGISGSTILGDGTVALIIDVVSILELARQEKGLAEQVKAHSIALTQ